MLVGTLPFAVGQVQDVGLIILSSLAQPIASRCAVDGVGEAKMLTTTLLFLFSRPFHQKNRGKKYFLQSRSRGVGRGGG